MKLAIIGFGEQARLTHLPCIEQAMDDSWNLELAAIVDYAPVMRARQGPGAWWHPTARQVAVNDGPFDREAATLIVDELRSVGVEAAVVSTEPTVHASYAHALTTAGMPYFVDKPFICPPGVSVIPELGRAAIADALDLVVADANANGRTPGGLGCVNVTRRYDPALQAVREAARSIESQLGQSVTHVTMSYADGECRDQAGCDLQAEHSFSDGYGGLNHSGYHAIDTMLWLAGLELNDVATVTVAAQVRSVEEYLRSRETAELDDGEGWRQVEYDCDLLIKILDARGHVRLLTANILHESITNRSWDYPGTRDERLHLARLSEEVIIIKQGESASYFARLHELPHDLRQGLRRPRRKIYADQTLNPRVAHRFELPSHVILADDLYEFRDLRQSSKYRSFLQFLAKADGRPHSGEADLERHALTQVVQLLAADAIASQRPLSWTNDGRP